MRSKLTSSQRLIEATGSSRPSITWGHKTEDPQKQRLLEVQGQMLLKSKGSSQSHNKSYSGTKVTSDHPTGYSGWKATWGQIWFWYKSHQCPRCHSHVSARFCHLDAVRCHVHVFQEHDPRPAGLARAIPMCLLTTSTSKERDCRQAAHWERPFHCSAFPTTHHTLLENVLLGTGYLHTSKHSSNLTALQHPGIL